MLCMKIILINFKFQLSRAKVIVKVAILGNILLAVRCFHLWTDFDITSYKVKVTVAVRRKPFALFWPSHL